MSTRAAYRRRIRRLLRDFGTPADTLASGIDASTPTVVLTSGAHAGAPMMFEIESTKELIYSASFSGATFSSCLRGFAGSSAAEATAGAQVLLGARWSSLDIDDAIQSAIDRMSSLGLYQMKTKDITYNAAIQGYDLATDVEDIYEVRAKMSGPSKAWPEIDAYDVVHDLASSEFASTKAVILYEGGDPGLALRVRYRARYGSFADDTADGSTLGIQGFAADLPQVGAMAELMGPEEAPRTQIATAIESQRSADVPPRHSQGVWQQLDARFRQRADEVLDHLERLYPPRTVRRP